MGAIRQLVTGLRRRRVLSNVALYIVATWVTIQVESEAIDAGMLRMHDHVVLSVLAIAKTKKPVPMGPALFIFGSGGRMAFAAYAAQFVSAPVNRRYESGRLGLNCSLAGSKLAHFQTKKGPSSRDPLLFGSGGRI